MKWIFTKILIIGGYRMAGYDKDEVVIDPGHGGYDPGGGTNSHFKEKDMVLAISLEQKKHFERNGIKVHLTRSGDEYMDSVKRTNKVKSFGAKYCISNHLNAGGGYGAETIHSIHSSNTMATGILEALVDEGAHRRRVFSRKGSGTSDYYYMHRMTGAVSTIIIEYGFADSAADTAKILRDWKDYAEAVVRFYVEKVFNKKYIPVKTAVVEVSNPKPAPKPVAKPVAKPAPKPVKPVLGKVDTAQAGLRVEAIVDKLRFYNEASWDDEDYAGTVDKGLGFTVIGKLTVEGAPQFKVKNSAGKVFYLTANPQYVKVEGKKPAPKPPAKPKAPSIAGKRVESKVDSLRFYSKPTWDAKYQAGIVSKGLGFTIISKITVEGSPQYKVKNSAGMIFYITASDKYVDVK